MSLFLPAPRGCWQFLDLLGLSPKPAAQLPLSSLSSAFLPLSDPTISLFKNYIVMTYPAIALGSPHLRILKYICKIPFL